jgi:N-acetylmuramoyl-L-alanine amidase
MAFKMKYEIKKDYLKKGSKKRPGENINVKFVVAHDTGNPGSTAQGNINFYKRVQDQEFASAHIFVDDKEIIECIPLLTGKPERAYHVIYNVDTDNRMYGDDANDIAGGVELCFGGKINNEEAYKRYVWVIAYICYKFNLNPAKAIVGHKILDPKRKIDPHNALSKMGKTYEQFLQDVINEYNECTSGEVKPVKRELNVKASAYKVEQGDTFWGIANQYGLDVQELMKLNPGVDPKALKIGQVINLKAVAKTEVKAPTGKPKRPYPGEQLKIGSRGREVAEIQRALGFKGNAVDGIFGKNTEAAVKTFQKQHGLTVDGIVGEKTWNTLF